MIWEYEICDKDKGFIKNNSKSFTIELNENRPYFTQDYKEQLGGRDYYFSEMVERRCGVAFACIRNNTLSKPFNRLNSPDGSDKRPKIHSKPSGFPESKKDNTVNNRLIFQRCHLVGYNLFKIRDDKGEENANLKKIFTGTRFMNNVMFYYEKKIYDYVDETENHVLYRVTPYFKKSDKHKLDTLVYGVQMEAMFINESDNEDKGLSFNVFVYNKQPYIEFDYEIGKNLSYKITDIEYAYVIDKKKRTFHINGCASVLNFDKDRMEDSLEKTRKDLIRDGYRPCAICDPGN